MSDRFTKTDLEKAKEAAKRIKDKRAEKRMKNSRPEKKGSSITDIFKSYGKYDGKPIELKGGGMSSGQANLAAKAPPTNKIDAKDFAVLRAEKAKGRGMGLQDESVQPGKVMKAKMGVATDYKKYLKGLKKATDSVKKDKENKFIKRRMKLMGMPKLSKGGGADSGTEGERRSIMGVFQNKVNRYLKGAGKGRGKVSPRTYDKITERTKTYALAQSMKDKDRFTDRDIEKASSLVKGKMGGGMMQKPIGYRSGGHYDDKNKNVVKHIRIKKKMGGGMIAPSQRPGYSKGTMVKARGCKLGRTRPTKIT